MNSACSSHLGGKLLKNLDIVTGNKVTLFTCNKVITCNKVTLITCNKVTLLHAACRQKSFEEWNLWDEISLPNTQKRFRYCVVKCASGCVCLHTGGLVKVPSSLELCVERHPLLAADILPYSGYFSVGSRSHCHCLTLPSLPPPRVFRFSKFSLIFALGVSIILFCI